MATIAIATQNQVKIRAIEKAFELFLGTSSNDVISIETKSGVGEQPFNKKVDEGAENRLRNLKSALSYRKDIDYYVACEGGVVKIFGQYYNVHVVIVEDRKGHQGKGIGQAYPIPQKYISEISETNLANVLDRIFKGEGGIRQLTRGARTRESLIEEAAIMSLTAIMNGEVWYNG